MIMTTKFYAPAVIAGGALSLSLAISAGAAHAVPISISLDGFNRDNGDTFLSAVAATGTGNINDGETLPFGQTVNVTSSNSLTTFTSSIDRSFILTVDGASQSETVAQTATVSFREIQGDGGGPGGSLTFARDSEVTDPSPFSFSFGGVGSFTVDIGGGSESRSASNLSSISDGSLVLPINVSFTAEAPPEPEPEPSPIPLPAGLPLLIGGLGAFAALRGLGCRS